MKNEISIKELEEDFNSSNKDKIIKALLYASFNITNWKWVQNKCIDLLDDKDEDIKGLAITCLGHLARIHGTIEKNKVFQALREKVREENLKGRVQDALDDIEMFVV